MGTAMRRIVWGRRIMIAKVVIALLVWIVRRMRASRVWAVAVGSIAAMIAASIASTVLNPNVVGSAVGWGLTAWLVFAAAVHFRRHWSLRAWTGTGLRPAVNVLTDRRRWWAVCSAVGLDHVSDRWSGSARRPVSRRVRVFPRVVSITRTPFSASVIVQTPAGQAPAIWTRSLPALAAALGVPSITVTQAHPGQLALALRIRDALASPAILDRPVLSTERDTWGLLLGYDEQGGALAHSLVDVSGVLVGGIPGSGKSAWLQLAIGAYAPRDDVALVVVDGRGGHDHDALAPRCFRYVAGDAAHDLELVAETLRGLRELMRTRISGSVDLYGHHSLWAAGPSPEHPAVFVLIDEFQAYMPGQFSAKADKELATEIIGIVTDLVKRGRSAGIVAFLATQRPTTDSIPSALRDNCSHRICFSVMTRDSAEAVLGAFSVEDPVSPIRQQTGIGVTVIGGQLVRFRAPFAPSEVIAASVAMFANLCVNPLDHLAMHDSSIQLVHIGTEHRDVL